MRSASRSPTPHLVPRTSTPGWFWRLVLLAASCWFGQAAWAGEPLSSSVEMLADAELHDVFFLDPDRGWAVGDRGVIWQTEDGGRRWELADSPTTARLRSICFIDQQHGWIAGGWVHPYTHRTSAVLLKTENGGRKWTRVEVPTLPALEQIRFATSRMGWATGEVSGMYSTGLYRTLDGGHTWESSWLAQGGAAPRALQAGDLVPVAGPATSPAANPVRSHLPRGLFGFVLDSAGDLWNFADERFTQTPLPLAASPTAIRLSSQLGWMVGRGGLVLQIRPGGNEWQSPPGRTPPGLQSVFDWHCVACREEKCWIAGAPGTAILHSADGGRTWRVSPTGQTTPIHRLYFLDDQHGWAVGPLGRILATRDGGQTWRVQRAGGSRAGLLALHRDARNLPLELLAMISADQGHLSVAAVMDHDRSAPENSSSAADLSAARLREAGSAAGVSTVIRRTGPASHAGLEQPAGPGESPLRQTSEQKLVALIRTWRPDILLTESIEAESERAAGSQFVPLVLTAAQKAADPARYPDQITVGGLQPWQVRKVIGALPDSHAAGSAVDTDRLSMLLGCSLADYTVAARGLLASDWRPVPPQVGYRVLWSQAAQDQGNRDWFSGMPAPVIGESLRGERTPPAAQVDDLTRAAQRVRNLREIAARAPRGETQLASLLPQLDELLRGLDPETGGRTLHQFALQFQSNGHYPAAAECLQALLARCPEHLLGDAALAWLVRYNASVELQRAFGARPLIRLPSPATAAAPPTVSPLVLASPAAGDLARAAPAGWQAAQAPQTLPQDSPRQALHYADLMRQTRLPLYFEPSTQFSLLAAARRAGNPAESHRLLNVLAGTPLPPTWQTIVQIEKRLLETHGRRPPQGIAARRAAEKPRLDGELRDPCWEGTSPIELLSSAGEVSATIRLSHDEEFLYVAIDAARNHPALAEPVAEVRKRDSASPRLDRIELSLDLDRDYHTAFQLTIDERGWTSDACCHDLRWDPSWYVATQSSPTGWQVEAAIPLAELTSTPVQSGDPWCLSLRRILPDGTAGIWPVPASPELDSIPGLLFLEP